MSYIHIDANFALAVEVVKKQSTTIWFNFTIVDR